MKIERTIEVGEQVVKFEGTLEGVELDLVIGIGLNYLLKHGALPILTQTASQEEGVH